jgi:hypothetical protein
MSPPGTGWKRPAQLAQVVLETRPVFLNLHLFICDRTSQVRKGLLELHIVLGDILSSPLTETFPGIPVLLLQILEAIFVFQGLPEELPRVSVTIVLG